MDQISDTNGIWHVRFNQSSILPGGKRGQTPSGCPSWANLHQIEEWKQAGLICWDNESKTLSRLNGSDTLELIKLLQETDTWQQNGIPIQHLSRVSQYVYEKSAQERPIKNSPIGTPAQTAKPSTTTIRWIEDMRLPSEAGPQLIELLERNETAIKEFAQREEEETKQALAKVYRILLTVHRRSAAKSIDLSKYSLKWQFDEQLNHLICNQLSKRATVIFNEQRLVWDVNIEEQDKPVWIVEFFSAPEAALEWAEVQLKREPPQLAPRPLHICGLDFSREPQLAQQPVDLRQVTDHPDRFGVNEFAVHFVFVELRIPNRRINLPL